MTLRILVPTDFSPAAGAALAVTRATFPDAQTELLHVVLGRIPPQGAEVLRGRLTDLGGGTLAFGDPAQEVLRCAREGHFDLIALGRAGGPGPGGRGRLGVVAERVVRESPRPVLTVPAGTQGPLPPRVLVLMDFTPGALGVLRCVRSAWPGAEVHLLHVVDGASLAVPFALPGLPGPALRSASSRALQQRNALWETEARRRLDELGGGEVARGHPAEVAMRRAREGGFGLLALGASAKGGFDRLMFGSVAAQITREAPLPVLTAHPRGG